jgi:hypothetical protein
MNNLKLFDSYVLVKIILNTFNVRTYVNNASIPDFMTVFLLNTTDSKILNTQRHLTVSSTKELIRLVENILEMQYIR